MAARFWARLLSPAFIDIRRCPNYGGDLKIIAAILESAVIERILTHLGVQAQVRPIGPGANPGTKRVESLCRLP